VGVSSNLRKRNYLVCANQNCHKCNDVVIGGHIPDDCEFGILHVLEIAQEIEWRKRQTGKTTCLVNLAVQLSGRFPVYYVTVNMQMVEYVKRLTKMKDMPSGANEKNIFFMSKNQVARGTALRGRGPGLVILDEVRPGEIEEHLIPPACYPVIAALWT